MTSNAPINPKLDPNVRSSMATKSDSIGLAGGSDLSKRVMAWIHKPIGYKAKSISTKAELISALLISKLLKYSGICNSRLSRRIHFYLADQNSFLVSKGPEQFILSSSDKGIGKFLFIEREPFDFHKLTIVADLLGGRHRRVMLIDVGANIGTICIPAVKRGYFRQAIALEPEPLNYTILSANILINNLMKRIVAYNTALGSKDDEMLDCELSPCNFGDHRIKVRDSEGLKENRDVIRVKSETFDKIIPNVQPDEALIWLDTQGSEGYVLGGASSALARQTPIVLEFWPSGMRGSESYDLLRKALIENGYKHFYDLERSIKPIPLSTESLDELYDRYDKLNVEGGGVTDLLIV
jgi:FkbM family methyltransferase